MYVSYLHYSNCPEIVIVGLVPLHNQTVGHNTEWVNKHKVNAINLVIFVFRNDNNNHIVLEFIM